MIEILKASAGSGKTFQLALKYISMLLDDEGGESYRHILAITFTNKATAEMKNRILSELYTLAVNPEESKYLDSLMSGKGKSREEIQRLSGVYIKNILHDYSSFAISTIDKFFQQTLRAFTREIGCFATYQVELDRDSLLKESIDRILDSISEDNSDLLDWISDSMKEKIARGDKFRLDEKMLETARSLGSGKYQNALKETGIDPRKAFSRENLRIIGSECDNIIRKFERGIVDAAEALRTLTDNKNELKQLDKYTASSVGREKIAFAKPTALKIAPSSHFNYLMENDYRIYNTAWQIRRMIYALGFVRDYETQMSELMKEKNVMSLEDSNNILKRIIDGSDAPFIYEKMGVRYNSFLLDEFQDTSRIQWENIYPLLVEADSKGGKNLVVGDVKQSIYRWRNSDWKLLDKEVLAAFPRGIMPDAARNNFRSCRNLVNFNSAFFSFAAERMTSIYGRIEGSTPSEIYADVGQTACYKEEQAGYVKVSFCQAETQCEVIRQSVLDALSRGASLKDMAVLVRTNRQGGDVANYLKSSGIDVVSDDSLSIRSSRVVTILTAKLGLMLDSGDPVAEFLLDGIDLPDPEQFTTLVDLAESCLRSIKEAVPDTFESEILYINGFMDILQDWSSTYGNNLAAFMEYWESSDAVASSPEGTDAVTIMTVHKAKGLEFPHVIIPFADKITFEPKSGINKRWSWCVPEDDPAGAAGPLGTAIYPVTFTKNETPCSLFEKASDRERGLEAIDTLNLFYVALTRARNSLHIISGIPDSKCVDAFRDGNESYAFTGPVEILYWYAEENMEAKGNMEYEYGVPFDFSATSKGTDEKVSEDLFPGYNSVPVGNRLTPSSDAMEYFGDDGEVGADASERLAGIELHDILSRISTASDIGTYCGHKEYSFLRSRIEGHPEWFGDDLMSRNEMTVIDVDGCSYRPDRIIFNENAVVVIDYKFGAHRKKYESQVERYVNLFRAMGYERVEGYLWYVYEDNVLRVR